MDRRQFKFTDMNILSDLIWIISELLDIKKWAVITVIFSSSHFYTLVVEEEIKLQQLCKRLNILL